MKKKLKGKKKRELEKVLRDKAYSESDIRDVLRHATGWRFEEGEYLIIEC